jgi:hypothetical protein
LRGTHLAPKYRWDQINEQLKMVTIFKMAVHDFVAALNFPKLNLLQEQV